MLVRITEKNNIELPAGVLAALGHPKHVDVRIRENGTVEILPVEAIAPQSIDEQLVTRGLSRAEAVELPGSIVRLKKDLYLVGIDATLEAGNTGTVTPWVAFSSTTMQGKVLVALDDETLPIDSIDVYPHNLELISIGPTA